MLLILKDLYAILIYVIIRIIDYQKIEYTLWSLFMVIFFTWVISYVNKSLNVNVKFCCLAEDLHLGFYYLDKLSDKLLFKNYFHFFDFANMNDRMTGASTAFGLLYNVNLDCLVSSLFLVNIAEQKIIFVIFSLTLSKHIKITVETNLYFWLTPLLMMKGG